MAGREPSAPSSRSARDACFKFLRRYAKDLDGRLTVAQKAEVLAYTALIETRLEPALLLSYWCEPKGFRELRKVQTLPLGYGCNGVGGGHTSSRLAAMLPPAQCTHQSERYRLHRLVCLLQRNSTSRHLCFLVPAAGDAAAVPAQLPAFLD